MPSNDYCQHLNLHRMTRKKGKKRAKPVSEKPAPRQAEIQAEGPTNAEEKPFDFGGLPDRDLKTNLGCG
jgi:hypothetical protein